jgi:hypothetical protein
MTSSSVGSVASSEFLTFDGRSDTLLPMPFSQVASWFWSFWLWGCLSTRASVRIWALLFLSALFFRWDGVRVQRERGGGGGSAWAGGRAKVQTAASPGFPDACPHSVRLSWSSGQHWLASCLPFFSPHDRSLWTISQTLASFLVLFLIQFYVWGWGFNAFGIYCCRRHKWYKSAAGPKSVPHREACSSEASRPSAEKLSHSLIFPTCKYGCQPLTSILRVSSACFSSVGLLSYVCTLVIGSPTAVLALALPLVEYRTKPRWRLCWDPWEPWVGNRSSKRDTGLRRCVLPVCVIQAWGTAPNAEKSPVRPAAISDDRK